MKQYTFTFYEISLIATALCKLYNETSTQDSLHEALYHLLTRIAEESKSEA